MGWPYDPLEAEKSFVETDLNSDGIIDPEELLRAMYDIYTVFLELALADKLE